MPTDQFILRIACPNRPGIVATVSKALFEGGGNIQEAHQFDDASTGDFLMRVVFNVLEGQSCDAIRGGLEAVAGSYDLKWELRPQAVRPRLLILVSKFDHCLADILYRWRTGELRVDMAGIISNYPRETYPHLNFEGVPFDYFPITRETKAEQEALVWKVMQDRAVDLTVLARYMQVFSDDLSRKLEGRCINIHHSFLPGFKGAKPYHQAHARGVKLIGATAHYVTPDLDEGPIIDQDVERVSHYDTPEDLVRKGRDIERRVLSKAIALHADGRVFANGNKTVVFGD